METSSDDTSESESIVSSSSSSSSSSSLVVPEERRRVGLVYDERMCRHSTPKGEPHPENPDRIRAVWNKLVSAGIPKRCVVFKAKEVEDKYLAAVHTKSHINLIKTISSQKPVSQRNKVAAKYDSIYFNEGSSESACLSAGSVLEVAEKVAKGELNSAFAIVRPPGHHAEKNEPMGFCLYNNVAIATSFLLNQKNLGIRKILIVDWDIHHGNATQKMFWKDPRVLVFSVHRHENGSFYPGGDDGSHVMVGEGPGLGYNINVPWENGNCGDADYIAVWDHILIPVARKFNPDIVLISAGFDAAFGDPLGGCCVTPLGFSILLKKLMEFSEGKIVMALEGGYNLESLANSALACVEVLLEGKSIAEPSDIYPFESTWRVIKDVREKLSTFWPILAKMLPGKLTNRVAPLPEIYSSQSDDEGDAVPGTLLRKIKCQNSTVRNSLSKKDKNQKASLMSMEVVFKYPPPHTENLNVIHEETPAVQETPLVDTVISVIPEKTTKPPIPKTPQAHVEVVSASDLSMTVLQRLSELEKKVEALSKINYAEAIKESVEAYVINEVKNQLPKFLQKAVSDYVQPRMESMVRNVQQKDPVNLFQSSSISTDSLTEYELKLILYHKMQKSRSYLKNETSFKLYNALRAAIADDEVNAKGDLDPTKTLKKRRHDDQDAPADPETEKKKRRQKDYEP